MAVLQTKTAASPAVVVTNPASETSNNNTTHTTTTTPPPPPPPPPDNNHSDDENDPEVGDKYYEDGDDIYATFSVARKRAMVVIMGFGAFVSMVSSTCVLPAVPEITETFQTKHTVVEISNAIYIGLLGVGCVVWGPMSQIYGRRPIILFGGVVFCAMGLGTALSPNLAAFFVFRALTAVGASALTILGNVIISDVYRPTERGTAISWFLSCSVIGPAFGPFLSGLIVQYTHWRVIFYVQLGCSVLNLIGACLIVPETTHHKQINDLAHLPPSSKAATILVKINPLRSVFLLRHLNVLAVSLASAALLFAFYIILVPIRFVLNPRFHLDSPLLSGVFYLVPGAGYLVATQIGGKYGDWMVKHWIGKRGRRVPEDRLRAGIPALCILTAGGVLVYGWTIDRQVGGMPVPLIFLFLQAVGYIMGLTMINTYCLENTPELSADIIAICWLVRYLAACVAIAVALPMIDSIGVGWSMTICAVLVVLSTVGLMATVRWGEGWREKIHVPEKPVQTEPADGNALTEKVVTV